jgi:hypothetical protein
MSLKIFNIRIVYLLLCIGISVIVFLFFHASKEVSVPKKMPIDKVMAKGFTSSNYTIIRVDTFLNVIRIVYKDLAIIDSTSNSITLTINDINQQAYSFYNGNENLLKFKLNDFGFEISNDTRSKKLNIQFEIHDNGINVPNDVMIQLTKRYVEAKK